MEPQEALHKSRQCERPHVASPEMRELVRQHSPSRSRIPAPPGNRKNHNGTDHADSDGHSDIIGFTQDPEDGARSADESTHQHPPHQAVCREHEYTQ